MSVMVQYATPRGAHISKTFNSMKDGGSSELERLHKRRTLATAYPCGFGVRGDEVVGAVWKNHEGKWCYYYEKDA